MRFFVVRLGLGLLVVLGMVRVCGYFLYACQALPFPFETHILESKMVHLAWRVQTGMSLYPDWRDYPHVCNNFGPVYFLIVGWLGRIAGARLDDLYFIGRGVTFGAAMLTSAVVGVMVGSRQGRAAGMVAAVISIGAFPMFGFAVMVRSDTLAEMLGLIGFLLAGRRSRVWCFVGCLLLVLSILTRQTTGVFLLARAIALIASGRKTRGLAVLAGSLGVLGLVVATVTVVSGPLFVRSLLVEAKSPIDLNSYAHAMRNLTMLSPDLIVIPICGVVLWTRVRPRDHDTLTLSLVLLATSFMTALKWGADINYFLSLRIVEALAVGTIWGCALDPGCRGRRVAVVSAYLGAAPLAMSAFLTVAGGEAYSRGSYTFKTGSEGRAMMAAIRGACRLAEDPKVRLLTDDGLIDIHQKERTAFADPFQLRTLVMTGLVVPRRMEAWIESEAYDVIVTHSDLNSAEYEASVFGLPLPLLERIRRHYVLRGTEGGLFYYEPRGSDPPKNRAR